MIYLLAILTPLQRIRRRSMTTLMMLHNKWWGHVPRNPAPLRMESCGINAQRNPHPYLACVSWSQQVRWILICRFNVCSKWKCNCQYVLKFQQKCSNAATTSWLKLLNFIHTRVVWHSELKCKWLLNSNSENIYLPCWKIQHMLVRYVLKHGCWFKMVLSRR